VLVLHGAPGMSDCIAPLAAELEDAFGVIRYQQRGLAPSATSGRSASNGTWPTRSPS
jgi:pimeloyl-ACP methyl ester carboxylesterase